MPTDHEARARELLEPYECRGDHCGNRYVLKLDATEAAQVLAQALAETEAAAWDAAVEAAENELRHRAAAQCVDRDASTNNRYLHQMVIDALLNAAHAIRALRKAKP